MANYKLSELNTVTTTNADSLVYVVQQDLSKGITIENFYSNVPTSITTTGNFDIINPGTNGGQYLSGGQPIATSLESNFALKRQSDILFLTNNNNNPFSFPVGEDQVKDYGNYTIMMSGGYINNAEPQRLAFKLPHSSQETVPDGWNVKLVQSGPLPIYLSAGPGVTVLSVNNTLSSGWSSNEDDIPYSSMHVYKVPTSNALNQYVVTHSLSCNGQGVARSDWS